MKKVHVGVYEEMFINITSSITVAIFLLSTPHIHSFRFYFIFRYENKRNIIALPIQKFQLDFFFNEYKALHYTEEILMNFIIKYGENL